MSQFYGGKALDVTTGGVIRVVTSSDAGYSDPKKPDRVAVAADIKIGLIISEQAIEIYRA